LKAGDTCPDAECGGKVYAQRDPGVLVRVKGQAPIAATVYELEKLRCHLCGKVFTAAAPEGAGEKKYDESAAAMMAVLRYGSGFPWNRLEGREENLGIPLPAATQCQLGAATSAAPLLTSGAKLLPAPAETELATVAASAGITRAAIAELDVAAESLGARFLTLASSTAGWVLPLAAIWDALQYGLETFRTFKAVAAGARRPRQGPHGSSPEPRR
jgi:hypothetical protein